MRTKLAKSLTYYVDISIFSVQEFFSCKKGTVLFFILVFFFTRLEYFRGISVLTFFTVKSIHFAVVLVNKGYFHCLTLCVKETFINSNEHASC